MGGELNQERSTRAYAPWLATLVPFAVYVWTTGAHSYWLDSGEFTAATVYLDIAHPPGHPLNALWSKPFALLPLGPLPFRVALAQGTAASLALGLLAVAYARTLLLVGVRSLLARELFALFGVALLATSHAFWFQAVRQEVYALQALFLCASLERLSLAARHGADDPRPFYAATLALGFGLGNHHFMSVLGIATLLYELGRLTPKHGLRPWLVGLGLGLLGLVSYVYLPIRASTFPPLDLGHPVTVQNLAWVVSAKVYAKRIGLDAVQPLGERFFDLLVLMVENAGFFALALALMGLYVLLRARRFHALAWLWGVTAFVSLAGRAWLNPVRGNPDVLGYMMPGFAALIALAVVGLGFSTQVIAQRLGGERTLRVTAALALVLGSLRVVDRCETNSLARFHATSSFDELRRRALPYGAVLVLVTPDSIFRHWDGEAVERLRPDISMVPVPFLTYGDAGRVLAQREPDLARLIESYLRERKLSLDALRTLAASRPVFVEGDTSETLHLYDYLVPSGLLFRLMTDPPQRAQIAAASAESERIEAELYATVDADLSDRETRAKLLWIHYCEALYHARRGTRRFALSAVRRGLALVPQAHELLALKRALETSTHGPLDIRPFLVGTPP